MLPCPAASVGQNKFRCLLKIPLWLGIAALGMSAITQADEGLVNPGPSLTTGVISENSSVYSGLFNPALGSLQVAPRHHWRMAYGPSLAADLEVGQVDNFVKDLNDLIDIIDDPTKTQDPVQTVLDRFNRVLRDMAKDGYVKNSTNLHLPLLPAYWRPEGWDGTLMLDAAMSSQVKASVLIGPLAYDDQNHSFTTATSAYLKGAIEKSLSLGYSQPLLNKTLAQDYGGQLFGGAKVSLYNTDLSKQTFLLSNLNGKNITDFISDEYDKNLETTTALGLDLGLTWVAEQYRVGVTLLNINQPSFAYGTIGEDCQARPENSISRSNCEAAAEFALVEGKIKTREKHEKSARLVVDGNYLIWPNWSLSAAADLASYDDYVGTQNQWLHLATEYSPSNQWLPDMRLGYHLNTTGSQLSEISAGLTFWRSLSLDAKMALDSVDIDGSSAPRSLAIALSVAQPF